MIGDRHLADAQARLRRVDDDLAGELHPLGGESQAVVGLSREGPHAAVGVGDIEAEELVEQSGKDRVPDIPVQPGHGAREDLAVETAAEHIVGLATPELRDERIQLAEVVGGVGVTHHQILPRA